MDVGARLRTVRKFKGLSQRELAERTGATNGTISVIEKNNMSPSISSLKEVLDGIPMSLVEFFSLDPEQDNHTQTVHKVDELIDTSSGAVPMCLAGKAHPSRAIALLDETYSPGPDTGKEMLNREGEKAGALIDGRLELTIDSRTYILERGDSCHFESNKPHRFRNPYDVSAHLISAITPVNF